MGSVTCEGQFLLGPSYLFIWRIHRVSPGQLDHGKMNGPALRFITFIQAHQPAYSQSLTSTHLEIALVFFFALHEQHFVCQHIFAELIRFLPSLILTIAVLKPNLIVYWMCGFSVFSLFENRLKTPLKKTVKLIWHPLKGTWRVHWLKETSHPFLWPMPTSELWTNSRHCHFSNKEWLCSVWFFTFISHSHAQQF